MRKRTFLIIAALLLWPGVSVVKGGEQAPSEESIVLYQGSGTAVQRAAFASFLSWIPKFDGINDVDTAISVSNVLAFPPGITFDNIFGPAARGDRIGTVEFYLWRKDGTLFFYETGPDTVAKEIGCFQSLTPSGQLREGKTYTILLSELLEAATGVPADSIPFNGGYGWVIGNFDAIAGTYNVLIFSLGVNLSFEFLPGMGQGAGPDIAPFSGWFGGIPVDVP